MLSELKKPKKVKDIRIRFTPKEKEIILSFVSNSNFENVSRYFRYLDANYRTGLLIEKHKVQPQDNISIEEISKLRKSLENQEEKSETVRNRISNLTNTIENEFLEIILTNTIKDSIDYKLSENELKSYNLDGNLNSFYKLLSKDELVLFNNPL